MNFSQLIKTLVDYLDLGKRIATTIPGIVLAAGILLFYYNADQFAVQRRIDHNLATLREQEANAEIGHIQSLQKKLNGSTPDEPYYGKAQDAFSKTQNAFQKGYFAFAQQAFYGVLLFGLLGFAIGTVLDPVNKALFLQLIPELGQSSQGVRSFLTGYTVLNKAKQQVVDKYQNSPTGERIGSNNPLRLSAQFYIGRGLISAAEYDGLVADYYRFTEISIGMIIPTLVVGAAICYLNTSCVIRALVASAAVILAFVLQRVGLRRYGEFRANVFDLISGREQAHIEQTQVVPKDEVLGLARAVHKAEQGSARMAHSLDNFENRLGLRLQSLEETIRRLEQRIDGSDQA
jgi:hypothetical protein